MPAVMCLIRCYVRRRLGLSKGMRSPSCEGFSYPLLL